MVGGATADLLGEDGDVVGPGRSPRCRQAPLNDRARQAEAERDDLKRRLIQVEEERDEALRGRCQGPRVRPKHAWSATAKPSPNWPRG